MAPRAALTFAFLFLAGAFVAGAAPAAAQTLPYAIGAGGGYESYTFLDPLAIGIERVSLATFPFAARVRPSDRIEVELSGAFARGSLARTDGSSATISGWTDTRIRAAFSLVDGRATVGITGLLPTGKATQTADEVAVAGVVASDLLPFRISNWGTGGGIGLNTTLAVPVRGFGLGVSAGYTMMREFEPLDESERVYRPGDEFQLRIAADRTFGSAVKGSLVLGLRRYADDALDGESFFEPGNRYEAIGAVSFAAARGASAVAYLGVQHRGAGTFTVDDVEAPARDLILAGARMRVLVGRGVLLPALDTRVFRRSDGVGQGYLADLGLSLEWPVRSWTLVPTLRTRFGKVLFWEGEDGFVRGGEIGLAVRLGGLRP
ncbi:MAG TPA: hypothetical protein VF188_01690 [Longimicrobiales bacterium]